MNAQRFPIAEEMARVVSNDAVNSEYFHMILEASAGMQEAAPGQFFHLRCPGTSGESPLLRRPMSVYRVDRMHGRVEFLYKVTGAGTRGLATLRRGESLDVFGPLGRGFHLAPRDSACASRGTRCRHGHNGAACGKRPGGGRPGHGDLERTQS